MERERKKQLPKIKNTNNREATKVTLNGPTDVQEGYREQIPKEWPQAYITSVFKKGDRKIWENYQGIRVISSTRGL